MNHQTKSVEVEIKAAADKPGIVAYASTFDRVPDSYGEIVAPGAFTETLKAWEESGNTIPLLYNHIFDDPFMNIGSVRSAKEDDKGLLIEADFDTDNETAMQVYRLVKEGRLSKMSFAFDVLEAANVTLEDGTKVRELRKLEIFEVSVVLVPANSYAEIIDAKAGRRNSKADEDTINEITEALEGALEKLHSLLAVEEEQPEPEPEPDANPEEPAEANGEEQEAKERQKAALQYINSIKGA